jgi:hypothetical protein
MASEHSLYSLRRLLRFATARHENSRPAQGGAGSGGTGPGRRAGPDLTPCHGRRVSPLVKSHDFTLVTDFAGLVCLGPGRGPGQPERSHVTVTGKPAAAAEGAAAVTGTEVGTQWQPWTVTVTVTSRGRGSSPPARAPELHRASVGPARAPPGPRLGRPRPAARVRGPRAGRHTGRLRDSESDSDSEPAAASRSRNFRVNSVES